MRLSKKIKSEIKTYATASLPNETGGVIVSVGRKLINKNCQNISANPKEHLMISPDEIKKIEKEGKIVAFWHSHPENDTEINLADVYISERLGLTSIIYCVKEDLFLEHNPTGIEIPLLNRPYVSNVFDCLQLVIDYYDRLLNIKIDYLDSNPLVIIPYDKWIDHPTNVATNDMMVKHLIKNGFKPVERPAEHDIILCAYGILKAPSHFAIYQKNNRILHHPYDALSKEEHYGQYWKNRTKGIFRHQNMF